MPSRVDPAERALWKTIQTRGPFAPVYYFYGDEEYLKEQALRELIAAAVEPATRDFNVDVRSAPELDAATLGSLVATPPMMAARRVVALRDVGLLRKDPRAALARYLERPAPDVVLVLVDPGGEKAKPDRSLIGQSLAVEFTPLDGERLPRWINRRVTHELGTAITPEACELLQRAVGNDLAALAAELDKLTSYAAGRGIDEATVSAVVGVRRGETLGDLLDRVAERDAPRALDVLEHVISQPNTSAVQVVMALAAQTLALGWGLTMRARGTSPGALESQYWDLLRGSGRVNTGRPWGDAIRAWMRALDRWDLTSVDAAIDALLAADIALKETRISSDEQVLATLILTVCASPSSRVSGFGHQPDLQSVRPPGAPWAVRAPAQ
jgi:DNA polymerase-3 subunit delta